MFKKLLNLFSKGRLYPSQPFSNLDLGRSDFFNYEFLDFDKSGRPEFWKFGANKYNTPSKEEMLNDGYADNPYFFSVIDRLAQIQSQLKRVFVNEDGEIVTDQMPQDLLDLLKRPNDLHTMYDLYYRIDSSFRAAGEAFVCCFIPLGSTEPSMLFVPSVKNVDIIEGVDGLPESYIVQWYNKTYNFAPEKVLHIFKSDITEDRLNGISSNRANRFVYRSSNEINKSEYFLHKNKTVNGILTNDGEIGMSPKERAAMQRQFDVETTDSNFSKVRISSHKLRFIPIGTNLRDLESVKSRIDHLRQACAAQSVSSVLFNDPSNTSYNNMQLAKVAMYEDSILPIAQIYDKEISDWLIQGLFGLTDINLKVDTSAIKVLSKPDLEISNKIVSEFNSGLINRAFALHKLYPEVFPMPAPEDMLNENPE